MIEKIRNGINENNEFATYHPAVIMAYFIGVISITMSISAPALLVFSLVLGWIYSVILKGTKALKFNFAITGVSVLFTTIINTFFTHDGKTVLFYINDNGITLEAFLFGLFAGIVLTSIIIWFSCFNVIVNGEMIMYLFSRISSLLGLLISMVLRYIPLLKARYEEISLGQRCLGKNMERKVINKVRMVVKKVSILTAWSLESSIDSADAMAARGYGLKGRTTFHLYKFTKRDLLVLTIVIMLFAMTICSILWGSVEIHFYPEIKLPTWQWQSVISLLAFVSLATLPIVIDILGEIRWQKLESKI